MKTETKFKVAFLSVVFVLSMLITSCEAPSIDPEPMPKFNTNNEKSLTVVKYDKFKDININNITISKIDNSFNIKIEFDNTILDIKEAQILNYNKDLKYIFKFCDFNYNALGDFELVLLDENNNIDNCFSIMCFEKNITIIN